MIFPPNEEIRMWADLCDEHAKLLIDEDDCGEVNRLGESDWPCLIEGCDERATVQGCVSIDLPVKKVQ